jgi:hypothetical protein
MVKPHWARSDIAETFRMVSRTAADGVRGDYFALVFPVLTEPTVSAWSAGVVVIGHAAVTAAACHGCSSWALNA